MRQHPLAELVALRASAQDAACWDEALDELALIEVVCTEIEHPDGRAVQTHSISCTWEPGTEDRAAGFSQVSQTCTSIAALERVLSSWGTHVLETAGCGSCGGGRSVDLARGVDAVAVGLRHLDRALSTQREHLHVLRECEASFALAGDGLGRSGATLQACLRGLSSLEEWSAQKHVARCLGGRVSGLEARERRASEALAGESSIALASMQAQLRAAWDERAWKRVSRGAVESVLLIVRGRAEVSAEISQLMEVLVRTQQVARTGDRWNVTRVVVAPAGVARRIVSASEGSYDEEHEGEYRAPLRVGAAIAGSATGDGSLDEAQIAARLEITHQLCSETVIRSAEELAALWELAGCALETSFAAASAAPPPAHR